jgi:4-aminobutyrate aminotransferase
MYRSQILKAAPKELSHYTSRLNPGIGRAHKLLLDRGQGSYLYDASGKKYLDLACGIGVTNLGHCHPRLVKVVQNQATKLWHGQLCHGVHAAMADLIEELETILPENLNSLMFSSTGAEAVETALKIARSSTGRQNIVVMQGGFHGRTNACLSLTTSKYVYAQTTRPLMPGVVVAPPPYATQLHIDNDTNVEVMSKRCLAVLEDLIHQASHPSEVAMLLVEPVLGEGGYLPLPAVYLRGLRQVCDKYGILLAFDEVQSGFMRTGSFFAFSQFQVMPDILIFAKGIANGLPLAGVATRQEIAAKCPVGTHGGTYAGNAIACASAAEVIRVMKEEKIFENVAERNIQFMDAIKVFAREPNSPISEIRGRGLMIGIQFDAAAGFASAVVNAAAERGLILLNTSKYEVLRLIPPLNITEKETCEALQKLFDAIRAVSKDFNITSSSGPLKPCCATACYGGNQPCRWLRM